MCFYCIDKCSEALVGMYSRKNLFGVVTNAKDLFEIKQGLWLFRIEERGLSTMGRMKVVGVFEKGWFGTSFLGFHNSLYMVMTASCWVKFNKYLVITVVIEDKGYKTHSGITSLQVL
jgi:hypothetical protein